KDSPADVGEERTCVGIALDQPKRAGTREPRPSWTLSRGPPRLLPGRHREPALGETRRDCPSWRWPPRTLKRPRRHHDALVTVALSSPPTLLSGTLGPRASTPARLPAAHERVIDVEEHLPLACRQVLVALDCGLHLARLVLPARSSAPG